jgi:hypothetical protein
MRITLLLFLVRFSVRGATVSYQELSKQVEKLFEETRSANSIVLTAFSSGDIRAVALEGDRLVGKFSLFINEAHLLSKESGAPEQKDFAEYASAISTMSHFLNEFCSKLATSSGEEFSSKFTGLAKDWKRMKVVSNLVIASLSPKAIETTTTNKPKSVLHLSAEFTVLYTDAQTLFQSYKNFISSTKQDLVTEGKRVWKSRFQKTIDFVSDSLKAVESVSKTFSRTRPQTDNPGTLFGHIDSILGCETSLVVNAQLFGSVFSEVRVDKSDLQPEALRQSADFLDHWLFHQTKLQKLRDQMAVSLGFKDPVLDESKIPIQLMTKNHHNLVSLTEGVLERAINHEETLEKSKETQNRESPTTSTNVEEEYQEEEQTRTTAIPEWRSVALEEVISTNPLKDCRSTHGPTREPPKKPYSDYQSEPALSRKELRKLRKNIKIQVEENVLHVAKPQLSFAETVAPGISISVTPSRTTTSTTTTVASTLGTKVIKNIAPVETVTFNWIERLKASLKTSPQPEPVTRTSTAVITVETEKEPNAQYAIVRPPEEFIAYHLCMTAPMVSVGIANLENLCSQILASARDPVTTELSGQYLDSVKEIAMKLKELEGKGVALSKHIGSQPGVVVPLLLHTTLSP